MSDQKPTYRELEKLIDELQSEEKLKQSEARFSMLLEASEDMITIHEPNGKYLYYNGPACYAITAQDIVGKMPHELFEKDVANTILNTFEKVAKTGESETIEVFFDWLGEKRWFSEYIYPVKNADGEVVELVKVCRDIHRRKIAEQRIEAQNIKLLENQKELKALNEEYQTTNQTLNQANEELREAKDNIEESEIRFRTLFNNSIDAIGVSKNGIGVFFNPAYLKLFGYESEEELKGEIITTHIASRERERILKYVKDRKAGKPAPNNYESIGLRKDGEEFEMELTVSNYELANERYTLVIIRDITQRKLIQKKLEQQTEKLFELNDALNQAQKLSHVGSWEYIIATDTVTWSKELFNIFERPRELGAPNYSEHQSLYTEESFARMAQAVDECVKYETPYDIELDIYTSNGSIKHIVSRGRVKKGEHNQIIGCYGTAQDITQRKSTQQKLERQTEKLFELNNALNQAQKLSHVGSWQWDMATDQAEWSDEMYNIYGVTKDSFYPSNENVIKAVLPEDLYKVEQGIDSLLKDEMFVPFEFRIRRPSGEIRYLYIVALEKKSGKNIFGVTKDITDQKKSEAELINANKELEVFFYRTSHDLRAPLARIMGLLQIIAPSQNLDEIKSYMELIELSTFKLNNTLNDLIEIIQVRKGKLEKVEVDIEEMVDEIFETHHSQKDYPIELRKSFEHKTIYTDCIYLKIILRNLISNALKFSTDFRDSYILVETSRTDKTVKIKVEDNGIGIREEAKDHLFEMFYRGGNENSEGTGLGLFIVQDAINKLGGNIYFESRTNEGSTFYVELPLE